MQESRPVSQLSRLFLLIGDQGVGLDFSKPSTTYFVIFRDRERTVKFREQLSNRIAEEARGSALPEVDLAAEQEHIVRDRCSLLRLRMFQLGPLCFSVSGQRTAFKERDRKQRCLLPTRAGLDQW